MTSTPNQADRIRESVLSLVASANEGMPSERKVSHRTAIRIADRSMLETEGLPFSVREHRATKDISEFISIAQHNKANTPQLKNTDLLVVGHPRSTKQHAMTAAALRHEKVRWLASDPHIEDSEVRSIVASALSAQPNTPEYDYYRIRLFDLPSGSIPRAIVAAFGDGNSSAARSARARMQRRDRKGRFAWMGGGLRALVRRAGGLFSLSGRMVGQGVGSDDTFDMELPNGRLVRLPAQRAEALKAVITRPGTDGYSPRPARSKAGDPVIDEADLIDIPAPNGYRVDDSYDGPGERFTDDAYDVTRFDAADPEAPELPEGVTRDPNRPILAAARRDGDKAGEVFKVSQSWADIQDGIRADEVDLDKSEGRTPDPIAMLDDADFERLRETVGDSDRDPMEVLREMRGEQPERQAAPDMADFEFDAGRDAYEFDTTEEYTPRGRGRNDSEDYTDEPELLADMFDPDDLIDAMRSGVLPDEDGNEGSGRGALDFGEGDELVPVEAIHAALREKGVDADMELAKIYDENNGNSNNVDNLNRFRGEETPAEAEADEFPEDKEPAPLEAEMPALFDGLSREEQQRILDTGEWKQYLSDNAEADMPEGYYTPDSDHFENVDEVPEHDPLNNTREYTQEQLEAAYRESLEPSSTPGYGTLTKTDADGEETSVSVPAESLRDSLKMMDVDTDKLTDDIASEGRDGQEELDDAEAIDILEEEGGQQAWNFSEEEVAAAKEDADALGYEGVSELIDEEPTLDEVVERLYEVGGDELIQQVFGSRFEQDLADRETADAVEEPTEEQFEKWTRMDRFLNFMERLGGGPGFIHSDYKPKDGSGDSLFQRKKKEREARERAAERDAEKGAEGEDKSFLRQDNVPRGGVREPENETSPEELDDLIQRMKDRWENPEEDLTPTGGLVTQSTLDVIEDIKRRKSEMDGEEPKSPAEEKADKKARTTVDEWRERNRERAERDRERLPDVLQRRIDDIDKELDALDPDDEDSWIELVAERIRYQQMMDDLTNPAAGRGGGGGRRRPRRPAGADGGEPRRPRQPRRPRREPTPEDQTPTPDAGEEQRPTPEAEAPTPTPEPEEDRAETPEVDVVEEETPRAEAEIPDVEELVKEVEDAANVSDPDINGNRNTGDPYRPFPNNANNVFNEEYVNWLLSPDRDSSELTARDVGNLRNIVSQMTDAEFAEVFGSEDREDVLKRLDQEQSTATWEPEGREPYQGVQTELVESPNPSNDDVADVPESETPEVENYVAPDAEPPILQENPIQRRRREARNRNRAAANGRDDAAPDVDFLQEYRGRQRLLRGAKERLEKAQDQLKKLYSGWESRGRHMPRPEHIIISREEDPSLIKDGVYRDRNGNIIRVGDTVAHVRVGDLINPDREAVNLIKGKVVERGSIVRPDANGNPRTYEGYLTVLVEEADDPEWVGQYFTYRASKTEILSQPDLRDQARSMDLTETQNYERTLWITSDEDLYALYINRRVSFPDEKSGEDNKRSALEREMAARGLVNPQDLADFLTHLTDEGLNRLPEDIGRNEGVQGRLVRELIKAERERRRINGRDNRVGEVKLSGDLALLMFNKGMGRAAPDLGSPDQTPAAADTPEAEQDLPAPGIPNTGADIGDTDGIDPRAIPERYVPSDAESISPQGAFEGDPNTRGISDSDVGAVSDLSSNPEAVQSDYSSDGWDSQRAAEIAEAARSRASIDKIADLVSRYERREISRDEIEKAIGEIYGVDRITFGDKGLKLAPSSIRFTSSGDGRRVDLAVGLLIVSPDGLNVGTITRNLHVDLDNPERSYASNEYFRITDSLYKGGGVSDSYNRWMENWYIANNISRVNVHAVGDGTSNWTGGVTWALNNFEFDDKTGQTERVLEKMDRALRNVPDEQRAGIERDIQRIKDRIALAEQTGDMSLYPTPLHLALVGWRPGIEKDWFGYSVMWNTDWYGHKILRASAVNQMERVGYDDIMRVARKRVKNGDNSFAPSADITRDLGAPEAYDNDENSVISPFRDEIIPFMSSSNRDGVSLAALSPAARHALSIWASKKLESSNDRESSEELARLIFSLREESIAYDKRNGGLGNRGEILKSLTEADLPTRNREGRWMPVSYNGQSTGFEARLLTEGDESGVSNTWMIRDTTTGQMYFIKQNHSQGGYGDAETEAQANAIGQAFGNRGIPQVEISNDPEYMVTTFAGDGNLNAIQTWRPADEYDWDHDMMYEDLADRLSIADLTSLGLFDLTINHGDRHMGNFLVQNVGNYGVVGGEMRESVIPLMIDNGISEVDRETYYQWGLRDGGPGDLNVMLSQRLRDMTPEARRAIIRENAQRALDRLLQTRDPRLSQRATDIVIEKLRELLGIEDDFYSSRW